MNKVAVAKELVRLAKSLVDSDVKVAAVMTKRDFDALASMMVNTGVAKNERFVTALVDWLESTNEKFDGDKFREALK